MAKIGGDNYLCIGCGVCKAACKPASISIIEDALGRYKAYVNDDTCINCGVCGMVCPVYRDLEQNRGSQYDSIVKNYIQCYKGYDEKFRKTSASGGLLTSFLYGLLSSKVVDTVVCLKSEKKGFDFYKYDFVTQPDELIKNSRSAYYPMEMSGMLEHIRLNDAKYALVVLPCQAKAIRLLQKTDRRLRERILLLAGLVCGGLPGKAMVEYISSSLGCDIAGIESISFREKEENVYNNNYSISLKISDNYIKRSHFQNEAFGFAYFNKLFHYKACNICDDIFAEHADVVFMDAWLDEHRKDKLGTSICITRSGLAESVAHTVFSKNSNVKQVNISVAIEAQNNVGLVLRKKKQCYFKRKLYCKIGFLVPTTKMEFSFIEKFKFLIRGMQEYLIQYYTEQYWIKYKKGIYSFNAFNSKIIRLVKWIKIV